MWKQPEMLLNFRCSHEKESARFTGSDWPCATLRTKQDSVLWTCELWTQWADVQELKGVSQDHNECITEMDYINIFYFLRTNDLFCHLKECKATHSVDFWICKLIKEVVIFPLMSRFKSVFEKQACQLLRLFFFSPVHASVINFTIKMDK